MAGDLSGWQILTGQPVKKAAFVAWDDLKKHKILFHRNADQFRKADGTLKERIADAIDVIAQNPHLDSHIRNLKGDLKHMHRFRMGDLPILYEIDDA